MTEPVTEPVSHRQALALDPFAVLSRVPAIGNMILGVRADGALLEGLGAIDSVELDNGFAVLRGPARETRFELAAIAKIVTDQMVMKNVLPFIEIFDADGNTIAKMTALDGLERFDAALEGLARTPLDAAPPAARPGPGDGPADGPLKAAEAAGKPVTLKAVKHGVEHRWTGTLTSVSFSHGFLNAMEADMHLHIRAGAIASWREESVDGLTVFSAIDGNGKAIGLSLSIEA
ncbi:hypothetical protein K32_28290 [Kaistia sp. 32K]|uniref:hypothetical protein n=1 Tax=Kaistia sp. 32K TaxID=2795690 RepID=UPI001915613A|nr:hypothetical protein [Kaistia sp. 32K]BCP54212.1 hypothetical protein K32_28290 [Kaistia sp. 32K]